MITKSQNLSSQYDQLSIQDIFGRILASTEKTPSVLNTKPWKFRFTGDQLSIYRDTSKNIDLLDPIYRQTTISAGILLHHISVAIHGYGWKGQIHTFPDMDTTDLLADVLLGTPLAAPSNKFQLLHTPWSAVPEHRDNMPDSSLISLVRENINDSWVNFCCQCESKNKSSFEYLIPQEIQSYLTNWANKKMDYPRNIIQYPEALVDYNFDGNVEPLTQLLIHTPQDNAVAWLQAGRVLGEIILMLKSFGLIALIHPWVIEMPELRKKARDCSGPNRHPQILLRVYAPNTISEFPPTPLHNLMYYKH